MMVRKRGLSPEGRIGGDDGAGRVGVCDGCRLQPACGQIKTAKDTRNRRVIFTYLLTINNLCLPDLLYSLPAGVAQPHIPYFDCIWCCDYYNQIRVPFVTGSGRASEMDIQTACPYLNGIIYHLLKAIQEDKVPEETRSVTMEKIVSLCKSAGLYLSKQRDIRRPGKLLGLWAAGRRAEEQYQELLVEEGGAGARRHGGHRCQHHDAPAGLGGQRPCGGFLRPAGGVQGLPPAVPLHRY